MHPLTRRLVRAMLVVPALVAAGLAAIAAIIFVQARAPARGGSEYVALGSSFAAGPGVGQRAPRSPWLCMRSSRNYPGLFAQLRGLDLTDVTCAGATTRNLLEGGPFFQRPQVSAVRPDTRVVTITVGGNDVAYLGNLGAWSCTRARASVPWPWRRAVCSHVPEDQVDRAFLQLEAEYLRLIEEVRRRAPAAQVALVDYVRILPDAAECRHRMPLTATEMERGRAVAARLEAVTRDVARQSGSLLVPASELSRGHDACATEPWVFPYTFPATPFGFGPLFYHPTGAAMAAIAMALDRQVSSR